MEVVDKRVGGGDLRQFCAALLGGGLGLESLDYDEYDNVRIFVSATGDAPVTRERAEKAEKGLLVEAFGIVKVLRDLLVCCGDVADRAEKFGVVINEGRRSYGAVGVEINTNTYTSCRLVGFELGRMLMACDVPMTAMGLKKFILDVGGLVAKDGKCDCVVAYESITIDNDSAKQRGANNERLKRAIRASVLILAVSVKEREYQRYLKEEKESNGDDDDDDEERLLSWNEYLNSPVPPVAPRKRRAAARTKGMRDLTAAKRRLVFLSPPASPDQRQQPTAADDDADDVVVIENSPGAK